MSPETHQRVRQLFDEALARPEAERVPFLQQACGTNPEVLGQVTQLLSAHIKAADFLEAKPDLPRHIGRYLVSRELGRGAMGIVYEAVDPLIGRKVAVKVIRLQSLADGTEAAYLRERLFREARTAGGLFHPGIAVILDVGQDGDIAYIAMEYVDGPSLLQMASHRSIGHGEILNFLQQAAAALDYAHAHGVVHRDIKPANIMLEKGVTVKVADFGIAKISSSPQYTQTGMAMGTPRYMSPEQVEARPLDGKSDQFSLAVVAYELLVGDQPFHADSLMALAHGIIYGPRPSARAVNPDLPVEVDQVFYRALAKLPDERYANCCEFVTALQRAFTPEADISTRATVSPPLSATTRITVPPSVATTAMPVPVPVPPPVPAGKPTRYIVGGAVAAALLAAAGLGYVYMHRSPAAEPKIPPAPPQQTTAPPVAAPPQTAPGTVAPHISRFLADPPSIDAGSQSTLSWDVSGATDVDVEPGIGKKPAAYSVAVRPGRSTHYKLTATNAAGTRQGEASVEVKLKPPDAVTPAKPPEVAAPVSADQLYLDGEAKFRDKKFDEAVPLLTKAAASGDVRAMLALGDLYGEKGDKQREIYWYQKAAEKGDVLGMLNLAGCYEFGGSGVPPNEVMAAKWFQKAAARNSPPATYDLAQMYEEGRGVPRDPAEARRLYQHAAELGNQDAKNWLARHRQ
jgi:tRNA A-37 threonylcarbamoyl transferase component Bud32